MTSFTITWLPRVGRGGSPSAVPYYADLVLFYWGQPKQESGEV